MTDTYPLAELDWEGQSLGGEFMDVSPDFRPNSADARILRRISKHNTSPRAIRMFADEHHKLTDYGYWFALGTLWVNYTGWSDLQQWKWLFSSTRPHRETSLMKPSELRAWRSMPDVLEVMRVHRPGEEDWISYTLDTVVANRFAVQRRVNTIDVYQVDKADALCLFLRRCESEVLVLDRQRARHVATIPAGGGA